MRTREQSQYFPEEISKWRMGNFGSRICAEKNGRRVEKVEVKWNNNAITLNAFCHVARNEAPFSNEKFFSQNGTSLRDDDDEVRANEIGRASCRERV